MTNRDPEAIRQRCRHAISYRDPQTAREQLRDLANYVDAEAMPDSSGEGALIKDLEARVATLLGKPAAVFMPSGKTAQLIALRLWCERAGAPTVAIHTRSHIEEDEARAYQFLHGLKSMPLGHPNRPPVPADVDELAGPIGAAVVELPLRNLGWRLPPWDDLAAISDKLRERGIAFHADAARIWEIQPCYDRPHAEIAALFDSLYVSFYKGLGSPVGAAIAGPADLIVEARLWQQRAGARLSTLFPYVVAAQRGLDQKLPLMPAYFAKARAIADALRPLPGVRVTPDPPHCNSFQIVLEGDERQLDGARLDVAEATGIWPYQRAVPSPIDGLAVFEVVILDAALALSEAEIAGCIQQLAERLAARSAGLTGAA